MRSITQLLVSVLVCASVNAEVTGFVEDLTDGAFDAPNWESVEGDGVFVDGGYQVLNRPTDEGSFDRMRAIVNGMGSFVTTVEIHNLDLGDVCDECFQPANVLQINHDGTETRFGFSIVEASNALEGHWYSSLIGDLPRPPTGAAARIQIEFDANVPSVTFSYDNDNSDDVDALKSNAISVPDLTIGGLFGLEIVLSAGNADVESVMRGDGLFTLISVVSTDAMRGDFNSDGQLDIFDIELLSKQVRSGEFIDIFDLNGDSVLDAEDRTVWVHELKTTFFGDANLDGEFSSTDLVRVFQAAEYEDNVAANSTWAEGDWNGDGEFTSRDLVAAFQDVGYEKGPRVATTDVPETIVPTSILLLLSCLSMVCRRDRYTA
jgi:hypothetical protein